MNVLALSNQKGGCGKTSSAINIAASLASLGKRTLLVDLDPQAHATFGLGVKADKLEHSIYNVLTEQAGKRCFMENIILPIGTHLDLAPSHILLSTIEQEFTNKDESVSRLSGVLSNLSFPYQYVVLDCPPSLGFLTFNALRAADTVIVPIELSSFSLMGVNKLLSMIELIRVKLQHTPRVVALPTMVDMRTRFAKFMMEEIRQAFGEHIFDCPVRYSVAVKESQAKGRPLVSHNPKSRAAIDYLLLSQEIVNRIEAVAVERALAPQKNGTEDNRVREFILKMPHAKEVHLVGDFNSWRLDGTSKLWQTEEGVWQKKVFLEPGSYRYKFVVDGEWTTDPQNERVEANPYGGVDSVLEID